MPIYYSEKKTRKPLTRSLVEIAHTENPSEEERAILESHPDFFEKLRAMRKAQRALLNWAACPLAMLNEKPDDAKVGAVFLDSIRNADTVFFRRLIRAIKAGQKAEDVENERALLRHFHNQGLSLRQMKLEWRRIIGDTIEVEALRQRLRRLGLRGRGKA